MGRDGGHWYRFPDGAPCYELVTAKGEPRKPTLRDAKTGAKCHECKGKGFINANTTGAMGAESCSACNRTGWQVAPGSIVPSVTTIIKDLGTPPQLRDWFKEQVARAAFRNPALLEESESDYLARVLPIAASVSEEAADLGTRVHRAIENWLTDKEEPIAPDAFPIFAGVKAWMESNLSKALITERSFATAEYGGRFDYFGLDSQGVPVLLDFKTQGFTSGKPRTYDENVIQLVAYWDACEAWGGVELPTDALATGVKLVNVYASTKEPGAVVAHEWERKEIKQARRVWRLILKLYQVRNNIKPLRAVKEAVSAVV